MPGITPKAIYRNYNRLPGPVVLGPTVYRQPTYGSLPMGEVSAGSAPPNSNQPSPLPSTWLKYSRYLLREDRHIPGRPARMAQVKKVSWLTDPIKTYLPKIFIKSKRVLRFLSGHPNLGTFKNIGIKPICVVILGPKAQSNPGQGARLLSRVK